MVLIFMRVIFEEKREQVMKKLNLSTFLLQGDTFLPGPN